MDILKPLDHDAAPDASRDVMNSLEDDLGFLPNLYRVLAHSPSALRSYAALNKMVKESSLTAQEQQVVLLATSRENRCEYCMAVHSVGARGAGLYEDVLESLREGQHIRSDDRLEALRQFAQRVVAKRGRLDEDDVDAFIAAGFDESNVLDVVLVTAMNTLSSYAAHIAGPPLDERYADTQWHVHGEARANIGGRRSTDRVFPTRSGPYSH